MCTLTHVRGKTVVFVCVSTLGLTQIITKPALWSDNDTLLGCILIMINYQDDHEAGLSLGQLCSSQSLLSGCSMNPQLPWMQRAELPDGTQSTTGQLCLLSRPLPSFPFPQKDQQKMAAKLGASNTSSLFPQVFSVACLDKPSQTSCAALCFLSTSDSWYLQGVWRMKLYLFQLLKSPLIRCKQFLSFRNWNIRVRKGGLLPSSVLELCYSKVFSPFLLCLFTEFMYACAYLFLSVCAWRAEDNLGCHSLGFLPPFFSEVGSLLGLELA